MTTNKTIEFEKDIKLAPGGRLPGFVGHFDSHPLPTLVCDADSLQILDANFAAIDSYGYTRSELLEMDIGQLQLGENVGALKRHLRELVESGIPCRFEARQRTRNGGSLQVDILGFQYNRDFPEQLALHVLDVTERNILEEMLNTQTAYFRQLFENSPDGIVLLDQHDIVLDVNHAFTRMFGYEHPECIGREINDLVIGPEHRDAARRVSREARASMTRVDGVQRQRKDGSTFRVDILGYPIFTDDGQVGIYGIYRDVTDKHEAHQKLEFRARHDSLTSLLNRREMEGRINRLLAASARSLKSHAFIYIDLDEFKIVNDTSGHLVGDQLLIKVSNELRNSVMGSDVVARLGGDEFGVLLYDCGHEGARIAANRMLESIRNLKIEHAGQRLGVGASLGVAMVAQGIGDFEELLNRADAACYAAKANGKNCVEFFTAANRSIADRREMSNWAVKLQEAMDENRFRLYRQAIIPLRSDDVDAQYEILLRLEDCDGTIISPGAFIPAAERLNLMPEIDAWTIRKVLKQLEATPGNSIYSINISGVSLGRRDFMRNLTSLVKESSVSPQRLSFEITETAAINRMDCALEFMRALRELGTHIALDDFGSGMSSFSYLKQMPVDVLKIDGSFIRDMWPGNRDFAIVESFNQIAHAFGIKTVAEFVETSAQENMLKNIGVDCLQGFGLHKPEPWKVEIAD